MRYFFLAAYDISSPKRQKKSLRIIRDYATGGQKSAFECYLSESERLELLQRIDNVIDETEDQFILLRLCQRKESFSLGIANISQDNDFICIG